MSESLVSAVIARILVGAGDAMTFTSVMRLLPAWFSAPKIPLLVQLTAMLGQAGQLLSSIPFAALLRLSGWTTSFAAAAAVSALVGIVVWVLIRNAPPGVYPRTIARGITVRRQVSEAVRVPGTRLAFWIHGLCAHWGQVFAFMWGYPFLTQGLGYSPAVTSAMFGIYVVAGFPFGPLVGLLSRRAPLQRTNLALLISMACAALWVAVLAWPGAAPIWLVGLLMVTLAACAPGSMIGMDVARATNPGERVGTASGIVNIGGFLGGLSGIWLIGAALDLQGGMTLGTFKVALSWQFLYFGIAATGAYVERSRARRLDAARGVRHSSLWAVTRRELAGLRREWRLGSNAQALLPPVVEVPVGAARTVPVTAVVPGDAGGLVAIDVPPVDPDETFWSERVEDYLALIASDEAQVTSIEIRVPDKTVAIAVRTALDAELARREARLPSMVVVR